jgi:hypothetical protein
MDIAALFTSTTYVGLGLFAFVCLCCYRMMQTKNYMVLLVWPIVIYFCGPIFTEMFAGTPFLGRFVFPEYTMAETLMIFLYFVSLLVADKLFGISQIIESSLSHPTMRQLSHSMAFLPVFVITALLAMALQIKLLHDFGSVLSGDYVMLGVDAEGIPFWGFLAGLYEIIFLLFVLFIISGDHGLKLRIFVIGAYCLTAAVRVAGGTRLILVKELAFVVILFYLRGRLKRRQLVIVVTAIVFAGSAIGLLRQKTVGEDASLGPLFGIVMESALDSLTLNIAYKVQDTGYIAQHGDTVQTSEFLLLSSIPSFARFSISPPELAALSPYNSALRFGFETPMPVGGMSGFATLCYICSYPALASILLAFAIGVLFRYAPAGNFKRITVLVFLLNAIHFWRDPVDIAVKQVVQDDLCALILLAVSSMRIQPRLPTLEVRGDTLGRA